MSQFNSTADRLRRATQLWHAFLAVTGERFELASFLKDPLVEKQTLDAALASSDPKLVGLARDWLRDTGQAGREPAPQLRSAVTPGPAASAPGALDEAPKTGARYLRGVR